MITEGVWGEIAGCDWFGGFRGHFAAESAIWALFSPEREEGERRACGQSD